MAAASPSKVVAAAILLLLLLTKEEFLVFFLVAILVDFFSLDESMGKEGGVDCGCVGDNGVDSILEEAAVDGIKSSLPCPFEVFLACGCNSSRDFEEDIITAEVI